MHSEVFQSLVNPFPVEALEEGTLERASVWIIYINFPLQRTRPLTGMPTRLGVHFPSAFWKPVRSISSPVRVLALSLNNLTQISRLLFINQRGPLHLQILIKYATIFNLYLLAPSSPFDPIQNKLKLGCPVVQHNH